MGEIVLEAKSFTIRKVISGATNKEMVKIEFKGGDNPLKSSTLGAVVLLPQTLRGLSALLLKFADENKDFLKDTNPPKDLGKISKPEDFPTK